MSSALGVVKREEAQGASCHNKGIRSQLLNDFCIFLTKKAFSTHLMLFLAKFSYFPQSTAHNFV